MNLYFKTYFLKVNGETEEGVFCYIDNENRLVSGAVEVRFKKENPSIILI